MNNLITFVPRKELTAKQNLLAFIKLSKEVVPTWSSVAEFKWESSRWVTNKRAVRFTNHEHANLHSSAAPTEDQLMHPEFVEMAKAYLRYRHHIAPHVNIAREISALRSLEYILRLDMGVPDITKVDQGHYDGAVALLGNRSSAPLIAGELLNILKRLGELGIVSRDVSFWNHHFHGSLSYDRMHGSSAPDKIKDSKLPDQDAILAIAEVFGRGYSERLEDVDVMVTSVTALLLSAPMRINELLRLRTDCLASESDVNGRTQYYLKYWVPKTKEFTRKPIPETMAEVAVEAIRRLTVITDEGRRLARYLESNSERFYRHKNCPNVSDDELLTSGQAIQAMGFSSDRSFRDYLHRHTGSSSVVGHTLRSLWRIVLKDHKETNPNFPFQQSVSEKDVSPLKMSESLFCFLRFQFSTNVNTNPLFLTPFNSSFYGNRLDVSWKKAQGKSRTLCFYTRHGFEPKKLRSHEARHLLNRLAKQNGLSVEVISAWSSRSTHRQTYTYLANDEVGAAATGASLLGLNSEENFDAPLVDGDEPIYKEGPVFRTRYGICRRSWRVGPCNKFADCLNCSELLICKGDKVAQEIISADHAAIVNVYSSAQQAIAQGERSATRWMTVMGPQIKKLEALLDVLNDPNIPNGSPIEIRGSDFSHEKVIVDDKAAENGITLLNRSNLAIEYGEDLLACLDELKG